MSLRYSGYVPTLPAFLLGQVSALRGRWVFINTPPTIVELFQGQGAIPNKYDPAPKGEIELKFPLLPACKDFFCLCPALNPDEEGMAQPGNYQQIPNERTREEMAAILPT